MVFEGLTALARHAGTLSMKLNRAGTAATRHLGKTVLERTRAKFGHYQTGAGPFPGWPGLKLSTVLERIRLGFTPDDPLERTGALRDSYRMETDNHIVEVGSESKVALGQEEGIPSHGVPARSTLGIAYVESEEDGFARLNMDVAAILVYGHDVYELADDRQSLVALP
jgi:hypothetical protein